MLSMLFLLAVVVVSLQLASPSTVSVIKISEGQCGIADGDHPDAVVVSTFNNTYNETG